jgi:hypothetical protein
VCKGQRRRQKCLLEEGSLFVVNNGLTDCDCLQHSLQGIDSITALEHRYRNAEGFAQCRAGCA